MQYTSCAQMLTGYCAVLHVPKVTLANASCYISLIFTFHKSDRIHTQETQSNNDNLSFFQTTLTPQKLMPR